MYYPYCTMYDKIEVVHTPLSSDGFVTVHFEEPDTIYGFKELDCLIPTYRISNIVGFSDTEASALVDFCIKNSEIILSVAKQGGIANAKYI